MKRRKKPIKLPEVLGAVMVENPYWQREHDGDRTNPRLISVVVNFRESAIATLAQKGALNAAQVAAANRFRALWEALPGKGAGAMDYARDYVDGGQARDPISEQSMEAGRELKRCRELLGESGYDLVCKIAGERHSLHEICETRRERDSKADLLRMLLTDLAVMWGYETRKRA